MPPVSEKQRRAMHAAAAGKSTIGIPASVGREFVGAPRTTARQTSVTAPMNAPKPPRPSSQSTSSMNLKAAIANDVKRK